MSVRLVRCKTPRTLERLDTALFTAENAEDSYSKPGSMWWVAKDEDGTLAGFCGLRVFTEDGKTYGELLRAGVVAGYRGKGLQRHMVRTRDAAARKAGCSAVITYTAPWNVVSANNLIKCGYLIYTPAHSWGLKDAIYFWKAL
jgi:RimJ/RimL family protein N-acetyltransferase